MTLGLVILAASVVVVWWIAGSRSCAYLLYGFSFVPFVTLDSVDGGLQEMGGFESKVVLLKAAVRVGTAIAIGFLLVMRRGALDALGRRCFLPVAGFVFWALFGTIGDSDALLPLMRLGELVIFALLGALLWSESARAVSLRSLLRWHAAALLPLILVTLFYAIIAPGLAVHVDASGLVRIGNRFINAETLGSISALVVLWASFDLREPRERRENFARERLLPIACFAIAVVTLVLARSRMAMIAVLAGELILWIPWRGATLRRWIVTGFVGLGALGWLLASPDVIAGWFLRGDSVDNFVSGTGRIELWSHLLRDVVPLHPLLGNGYLDLGANGGFQHAGTSWTNAHNAYLGALVYTGIPGLVLFLAIVLLPVQSAWRAARFAESDVEAWTLLFAWSVFTLFSNVTSFGVCGWPNPLMLFFFALFPIAVIGPRIRCEDGVEDLEDVPLSAARA